MHFEMTENYFSHFYILSSHSQYAWKTILPLIRFKSKIQRSFTPGFWRKSKPRPAPANY